MNRDGQMDDKEKLRRNILIADQDMLDENEFAVKVQGRRSRWQKVKIAIKAITKFLSPLKNDVAFIKTRYDRSVQNFFQFFRSIFLTSILVALGFIYLCISHLVSSSSTLSSMTDTYYPNGFFFSHFGTKLALPYSVTMIGFAIVTFLIYVYQWMKFDQKQQNYRLFKKDNIVFARIVINCWDWRRDTLKTARDQLKLLDLDS